MSSVRQLVPLPRWLNPTNYFEIITMRSGDVYPCESWRPDLFHFHDTVEGQCRDSIAIFVEGQDAVSVEIKIKLKQTLDSETFAAVPCNLVPGMNYLTWCRDMLVNCVVLVYCTKETVTITPDRVGRPSLSNTVTLPSFCPDNQRQPPVVLSINADVQPSLSGLVLQTRLAVGEEMLSTCWGLLPAGAVSITVHYLSRRIRFHLNHAVHYREMTGPIPYRCSTTNGRNFIVVGASHANRVADALMSEGHTVFNLAVPGWRVSDDVVADRLLEMCKLLEHLPESQTTVVYVSCLDNSLFMMSDWRGAVALPIKLSDRRYHVIGELVYKNSKEIFDLLESVWPLLLPNKNINRIWVGSLPRYLHNRCCSARNHLINQTKSSYISDMLSYVTRTDSCVKALAEIQNVPLKLLPTSSIFDFSQKDIFADAVHLKDRFYHMMALKVLFE